MSILNWIRERETEGRCTFSVKEVQSAFPSMSSGVLQNELFRLSGRREITSVHKGFYVRLPPRYKDWEIIPPYYYIDQLMAYLRKPYYISLLSAGELHGAAHQAPQRFCVCTTLPAMNTSENKNPIIFWNYRQEIPSQLLVQRNSETSMISFSCPELTAVDLVQYSQYIGYLSRAATVLAELLECTNFAKVDKYLYDFCSTTAFQRLGFIMDVILDEQKQAAILYKNLKLHGKNFRWIPLSKQRNMKDSDSRNPRWKIIENTQIEIDDI